MKKETFIGTLIGSVILLGLIITSTFLAFSSHQENKKEKTEKVKTDSVIVAIIDAMSSVKARVDTLSTHTANLYGHVAIMQINLRATDSLVSKISDLATKNAVTIIGHDAKLKVLESKIDLRARQVNDLSQMVFDLAYGKGDSIGNAMYAQYVNCGNQNLWDSAMVKLSPKVLEKIQRIAEIDAKLAELEKKPIPVEVKKADMDKISKRISTLEKAAEKIEPAAKKK